VALLYAASATQAQSGNVPDPDADDQQTVECRLPPQIRTLGQHVTYLAGGRSIHTSVAECKVRGGTYNGQGPGALAGRGSNTWAAHSPVPVIIGGDKSRAACPRSGTVGGLGGSGTLSVRSGPSTAAQRIDNLGNGDKVFMCDWSAGGDWVGVVYARDGRADCGVGKYILQPKPYAGACHSGWVSSRYVK
jgi:hypothetical protein